MLSLNKILMLHLQTFRKTYLKFGVLRFRWTTICKVIIKIDMNSAFFFMRLENMRTYTIYIFRKNLFPTSSKYSN